jgi:hypothetical protein
MFCVAETEVKTTVDEETRLFDLAVNISNQLQVAYEENRIPLMFSCLAECKKLLENSLKSEDANEWKDGNSTREFLPSNQLVFNYPTKYSWGEIVSNHTIGSYWCPNLANQVVLFQSVNNVMCFTVVCCDGEDNVRDAKEVFELFVQIVEHSGSLNEKTGVMDLVEMHKN